MTAGSSRAERVRTVVLGEGDGLVFLEQTVRFLLQLDRCCHYRGRFRGCQVSTQNILLIFSGANIGGSGDLKRDESADGDDEGLFGAVRGALEQHDAADFGEQFLIWQGGSRRIQCMTG